MPNQNAIKGLKFVSMLLATALALFARSPKTATATQDRPARLFEFVGMDVPLEKRFAPDDGAAFVIHFAGDTHGSLDTCG